MTELLVSTDWKSESYDLIYVIVNQLIKIVYYKLLKITMNIPGLAKVIIDVMVKNHSLPNSIIID